ncbi:MAG: SCO family protein [bacterium]
MRFALNPIGGVLAIVLLLGTAAGAAAPFPVIGKPAPDFTLTSQSGAPIRLSQFRGKLVVLDFIYTHCTDVCPLVTANLARVQRDLTARGWWVNDVVFVSVTTDPARDTPAVLRTYAQRYKADLRGWFFLTGSARTLSAVYKAYGILVRPASKGLQEHALPVFVIDRRGTVLGAYGHDFKSADMLNDLAHLR